MTSESIALLIAREYPPSTGPPPHLIYNLLKSVTTTTAGSSSPAADWAIGDWVEFLGPDQAWHLARITRVDEDRNNVDGIDAIQDAILAADEAQAEFIEQNKGIIGKNNSLIDTNREVLKQLVTEVEKLSTSSSSNPNFTAMKNLLKKTDEADALVDKLQSTQTTSTSPATPITDVDYVYDAGFFYSHLPATHLRCPAEGLRIIFGGRPFLWQQYALLQYESKVRFQKEHRHDFANLDPVAFASASWTIFLKELERTNPKHALFDARLRDRAPNAVARLRDHLLSPFRQIDSIRCEDSDWDFDDCGASAFTYLSVLGTGWFIPLACCLIQLFMLMVLTLDALFPPADEDGEPPDADVRYPRESYLSCPAAPLRARTMIVAVALYYVIKVVPDSFQQFYTLVGNDTSSFSRMMSLRSRIHLRGDDTFGQILGLDLEIIMNGFSKSFTLLLNVYILLSTHEVIDVVLNCIALEFVSEMDESFVSSSWWDEDSRFLRAGTIELVLRDCIRHNVLNDVRLVCVEFGIDGLTKQGKVDKEKIGRLLTGKLGRHKRCSPSDVDKFLSRGFRNREISYHDSCDENLVPDRMGRTELRIANQLRMDPAAPVPALQEYVKSRWSFGTIERWLERWFPTRRRVTFATKFIKSHGIFWKFEHCRTWRYWHKMLYRVDEQGMNQGEGIIEGMDECLDWEQCDVTAEELYEERRVDTDRRESVSVSSSFRSLGRGKSFGGRVSPVEGPFLESQGKEYKDAFARWSEAYPDLHDELVEGGVNHIDEEDRQPRGYPSLSQIRCDIEVDLQNEKAVRMAAAIAASVGMLQENSLKDIVRKASKSVMGGEGERGEEMNEKKKACKHEREEKYVSMMLNGVDKIYEKNGTQVKADGVAQNDGFATRSPFDNFIDEVRQTFFLVNMWESLSFVCQKRQYGRVGLVVCDWLIRWFVWTFTLVFFPLVILAVIVVIPWKCGSLDSGLIYSNI